MAGYTKLFSSIVHSTIWREENHVRLVWITMLAMADKNGIVEASIPGLGDAARVTLEECCEALERLMTPDEWSRSKKFEGRRIEPVDGGWQLLNYDIYRDKLSKEEKRDKDAERQRRYRLRQVGLPEEGGPCAYCGDEATGPDHVVPKSQGGIDVVLCCPRCNNHKTTKNVVEFLNFGYDFIRPELVVSNPVLQKYVEWDGNRFLPVTHLSRTCIHPSRQSESESESKEKEKEKRKKKEKAYSASFLSFWAAYPEKKEKLRAWQAWQKAIKRVSSDIILAAVEKHKQSDKWKAGYIKHPATWLNAGCWEDEIVSQSTNQPTLPLGTNTGQTSTTARLRRLEHQIRGDLEIDPGELRELSAVVNADRLNYPRVVFDWLKACERVGVLEMDRLKVDPFWSEPTRPSTLKNWRSQRGQLDEIIEGLVGE